VGMATLRQRRVAVLSAPRRRVRAFADAPG